MFFYYFFLFTWQQRVSYKITANLDTKEHILQAIEYLTYYNNSPFTLETLYLHLYPNAYQDNNTIFAQETKKMGNDKFIKAKKKDRGYIKIEDLTSNGDSLNYEINETVMVVLLNSPLLSNDSITLQIDFYLKIPKIFSRLGYSTNHYEIVQWYPKPCVFDEAGWHKDAYHALGEFYGEYGDFDVAIELPGDYVVSATGERINEKDIEFIDSLIINNRKIDMGKSKTVRFYAENVHDFAWVCDPDFLVERHRFDSITIDVFYTKKDRKKWAKAGGYAIDGIKRYNRWYGKYPYKNLSIVDGYFGGGMEYPNLVIIGIDEDFLTRSFESVIIHEIGHQWFYGILGSNEMDEAWLDEGFTTYAEIRYLEDKYGKNNSLFKSDFIPPLTRRYFHKAIYYLTWTNYLEQPILTPSYKFVDVPIAYANAAYSKPALFLFHLEGILGKETFDKILKKYFEEYKFQHPKTDDFIKICEENSGKDLEPIFCAFLHSTDFSDWQIKKISKNSVQFENMGNLLMPVDVFIKTNTGGRIYSLTEKSQTIILSEEERINKIIIDPYGYSFESNYRNNYYPSKIEFKPFLSWPSFDAYQIFFVPYLWYDSDDGFTPGIFFAGAEFIDFDFVKGRHQWTLGYIYGIKSKKHYPTFSYQTPIIFKRGWRTRINLEGSNSNDEDKLKFGFINNFGIPFANKSSAELTNRIAYYKLNSDISVDSIDWDLRRNIVFENSFKYEDLKWHMGIDLFIASEIFGGECNYIKSTLEIEKESELLVPFNIRFFAGRVFGTAPNQEKIFLCGALRPSFLADLIFSQKGYFSPQEHNHISGDGNMLGYQTMHIKTDELYCINFELPANFLVRLFADFGYYRDSPGHWTDGFDAGAKLVFGPICLNFPFYTKGKPWSFRWSIGF